MEVTHGSQIFMWVISKLGQNQEITVVEDHINKQPLQIILQKWLSKRSRKICKGPITHQGEERISCLESSKQIARTSNLCLDLAKPIKMKDLTVWVAKRPRDSSLNTKKFKNS